MPRAGGDARRFLTAEGQPRAFVIVSSARSGSNLLVTYLRQLSRAACFGEILRADFPDKPGWDHLVRRLELPSEARRLHATDLTAWWELVLARGLRRRRWLGAKVFYYHRRDDEVWDRFGADDHRIIHLWRDATFDQYVSRLLAFESGEWKDRDEVPAATDSNPVAGPGSVEPKISFDPDDYRRYRTRLRADVGATRARFGDSERYAEIEYRQLMDHAFVGSLLERLFDERIDVAEVLRRQRGRPKIEYLVNPADAEPFVADSIRNGFAAP